METHLYPVIFLLSTPVRNPALCQTDFKGMRDNFWNAHGTEHQRHQQLLQMSWEDCGVIFSVDLAQKWAAVLH